MAYSKSFASPEEQYAFKLIDHFFSITLIRDGEQKLGAAIGGEFFCWPFLEGSKYVESKNALYKLVDERRKEGKPVSLLNLADALLKLQQRAAKEAGIYGKKGISVVTPRGNKEDTKKVLDAMTDDIEDVT
jgi:hypothetical protein